LTLKDEDKAQAPLPHPHQYFIERICTRTMGERNFVLNNMLVIEFVLMEHMPNEAFHLAVTVVKETPVFQNMSKSLNTVRLEMWFEGENESMCLYRLIF
jgi:hypothetical protein